MNASLPMKLAALLLTAAATPAFSATENSLWQDAGDGIPQGRTPPVSALPGAPGKPLPLTLAASDMSYGDRQKLRQIERDIERISTSSIGTVQDRQLQINALTRQRDAVYGTYGVQPGTTVTIQDTRNPSVPGVDYYPVPPQTVLPPQGQP